MPSIPTTAAAAVVTDTPEVSDYLADLPWTMTVGQVAFLLGVRRTRVEKWIEAGVLATRRERGQKWVDTDSLRALIHARQWKVRVEVTKPRRALLQSAAV